MFIAASYTHNTRYWKTSFYNIAAGAQVPKAFYAPFKSKNASQFQAE